MADKVTPELSQVGVESTRVTVEDLSNPEHPVNNKGASGKRSGMGLIVQGHLWVAEGPNPSDPWYRVQKHNEVVTTILRDNTNTTTTASLGDEQYNDVLLYALEPVEPLLDGNWVVDSGTGRITYTGEECIFKFTVSGDIRTNDSTGLNNNMQISIFDERANDGLTGASKILPVTLAFFGATSIVDFTLVGWARVQTGDSFKLQAGSTFAGNLLVGNVLWSIEPTDTLIYA